MMNRYERDGLREAGVILRAWRIVLAWNVVVFAAGAICGAVAW